MPNMVPINGASYPVNFTAPALFFNIATFVGALVAASFTCLIALSSSGRAPDFVPKFALPFRDPIVLSLLSATTLGLVTQIFAILCRHVEKFCVQGFRTVSGFYILSYLCVNLFLLAKLRAVDAGLRAGWYHQLQRIVTLVTKIGMPIFAGVVFATTKGAFLYGEDGTYFCVDYVPWSVTVTFATLQAFAGLTYLVLFIMPLISTEKHVVAVVAAKSSSSLRPLIMRNLVSCTVSILATFVAMVGMSVAHLSTSPLPSAWTIAPPFIDLTVNLCAIMYAVKPAWKRQTSNEDSHASTRRNTEKVSHGHHANGSVVTGRSGISTSSATSDKPANAAGQFIATKHDADHPTITGSRASVERNQHTNEYTAQVHHPLESNPSAAEKDSQQEHGRDHSVSISDSELTAANKDQQLNSAPSTTVKELSHPDQGTEEIASANASLSPLSPSTRKSSQVSRAKSINPPVTITEDVDIVITDERSA